MTTPETKQQEAKAVYDKLNKNFNFILAIIRGHAAGLEVTENDRIQLEAALFSSELELKEHLGGWIK